MQVVTHHLNYFCFLAALTFVMISIPLLGIMSTMPLPYYNFTWRYAMYTVHNFLSYTKLRVIKYWRRKATEFTNSTDSCTKLQNGKT